MRAVYWILVFGISAVSAQRSPVTWTQKCMDRVDAAAKQHSNSVVYVDQNGVRTNSRKSAAGVSVGTCRALCGDMERTFSFSVFSTAFTNWLLPWLALAAQLPYETRNSYWNVLSCLLAIGSPAFVTYGLLLTMFNRLRIAKDFQTLIKIDDALGDRGFGTEWLGWARYILQESQQTTMRAFDGRDHWLTHLISLRSNKGWWEAVHDRLEGTRRGVTVSLVLQIGFAVVAWLFTVIAAFDQIGDVTTGLSISSSSIWFWMVPVVSNPSSVFSWLATHQFPRLTVR